MKKSRIISVILFITLLISCLSFVGCSLSEGPYIDYFERIVTNNSSIAGDTFNMGVVSNTVSSNTTSSNQTNESLDDTTIIISIVCVVIAAVVIIISFALAFAPTHDSTPIEDKSKETPAQEAPKKENDSLYLVAKGEKTIGPYPIAQLIQMANSGELHPNDHVWCKGMDSWIPAGALKELKNILPPPIPTSTNNYWESQSQKNNPAPTPSPQEENSNNDESCLGGCLKGCGILFLVIIGITILVFIFGIHIIKQILSRIIELI